MEEEWKDIEGYEGHYQVSNFGRVKSLISNKIRKNTIDKSHGYEITGLRKNMNSKTFLIHRLVAKHFVKKEKSYFKVVNHKDGNKRNNFASNLEWTSHSLNSSHAFENGLLKSPLLKPGKENPNTKGGISVFKDGEFIKTLYGAKEISEAGFTLNSVYRCARTKGALHKGFTFKRIKK